jgi:hypothetical protein
VSLTVSANVLSTTTNMQMRQVTSAVISFEASLRVRNNGHRVIAICHLTFLMIAIDIFGGKIDILPIPTDLHCRSSRLCLHSSSKLLREILSRQQSRTG